MGYTRYTRVYPIEDYGVTITTTSLYKEHIRSIDMSDAAKKAWAVSA